MSNRERKGVPEHKSNVLKGSFPQSPSVHPRNSGDPSIRGWSRRRVEMEQLREAWWSCTRGKLEADLSYYILNPAAEW